jgi:hypothetical protein
MPQIQILKRLALLQGNCAHLYNLNSQPTDFVKESLANRDRDPLSFSF